jgi:hypothetical protein
MLLKKIKTLLLCLISFQAGIVGVYCFSSAVLRIIMSRIQTLGEDSEELLIALGKGSVLQSHAHFFRSHRRELTITALNLEGKSLSRLRWTKECGFL